MVDDLRRRLLAQAYLFDDPTAYRAGVEDALDALAAAGATGPIETLGGRRDTMDRTA